MSRSRLTIRAVLTCAAVLLGCGDDEGAGGGSGSYASIAGAVTKPTGMLAQSNALDVAKGFETINVTGAGGSRLYQDRAQQKVNCPSGGSYSVTASGSQSNAHAVIEYDGCCFTAGCCINGDADWYISTKAGEKYMQCGTYDVDYMCSGANAALKYSGCMGTDGKWVYVVKVGDKTFSVTGSYRAGNGMLTITDAQNTWTCTYKNNTGSCTGGGSSFSF